MCGRKFAGNCDLEGHRESISTLLIQDATPLVVQRRRVRAARDWIAGVKCGSTGPNLRAATNASSSSINGSTTGAGSISIGLVAGIWLGATVVGACSQLGHDHRSAALGAGSLARFTASVIARIRPLKLELALGVA